MCGRFSFTQSEKIVAEIFQLASVPTLSPRYNIAPTQPVPTVLVDSDDKNRQLKMLRWGLIPSWSKDIKIGAKLINARAETVAEKPAFRSAFKRRRCLILADGFYEWQEQEGKKQPFYFRLQDGKPFAFAGLWERWSKGEDEAIASCTILTTQSNELMGPIHHRMPVILDPKDYDKWLDPEVQKPESLQSLLQPYKSEEMTFYPVTTKVNNAKTDSPDCIKKV
ncbi:SOS response-associated peptidase [Argonema antarcticum]|uniref:SOS response-associated peptidase n=1 Tax=Argonema antarcticum TaxID=2942763 RepID=UPI002011C18B|nr:SOS response-associated peptidase [Argonema antarcticum]MCL1471175.1 SOS response-associated peptidase [Argonema antarcticum A004/B2]